MHRLFFDTETTNMPEYHKPSDAAIQPHIVQLTALLTDYFGTKLSSLDLLIRPDGWTIDEKGKAFESHGITNALATAGGVPEFEAVALFMQLVDRADLKIAHNISFDNRIIRIALKRMGLTSTMETWKDMDSFDTMHRSTKHCKLPPTPKMVAAGRKKSFKTPTLAEAYLHFTGVEFKGAHNAMFDVLGCKQVYFAILKAEGKEIQEPPNSLVAHEPETRRAAQPASPASPAREPDPDDGLSPLLGGPDRDDDDPSLI